MDRVVLTSQIGADGILHVTVPFAPAEAHREVRVTIDEAPAPKEEMSREEWRRWVAEHAGCIDDPMFQRPEQGEYETRDPL